MQASSSGGGVADPEAQVVQKGEDLTGGRKLVCHKEVGDPSQIGLEEMDEEGEEILQGRREEKRPLSNQRVPTDTIGKIVKSEMKKILKVEYHYSTVMCATTEFLTTQLVFSLFQLQHEHLLELLDSTATASLPQTVTEEEVEEAGGEAQMEELQPTHHHHSPNPVTLQAGAVADTQTETEDSMAPVRWFSSVLIYRFISYFQCLPVAAEPGRPSFSF